MLLAQKPGIFCPEMRRTAQLHPQVMSEPVPISSEANAATQKRLVPSPFSPSFPMCISRGHPGLPEAQNSEPSARNGWSPSVTSAEGDIDSHGSRQRHTRTEAGADSVASVTLAQSGGRPSSAEGVRPASLHVTCREAE